MTVPPLPCPIAPQLILLQTARPGEFEQFGADGGGELRRQRPVPHTRRRAPGAGRGLGRVKRTSWLRRTRSRIVLIKPEADVGTPLRVRLFCRGQRRAKSR